MGERTKYTPGTFSWVDLTTTDQEAAKSFYAGLFGWEADDRPAGNGVIYSMQQIGGKSVAAISPQPKQQREMGLPPLWNSYITVDSADDAAGKAGDLGATVHAPPFDVMDVGRMAVIADPQGAFFMVWEPRSTIGAELVNVPGALCWNELYTSDLDAAKDFYGGVFGWEWNQFEQSPDPYFVIMNQGRSNGGVRKQSPQESGIPPHWIVYFTVENVDEAAGAVESSGGRTLAPAMDLGPGRIAVMADPQGAAFALFQGDVED